MATLMPISLPVVARRTSLRLICIDFTSWRKRPSVFSIRRLSPRRRGLVSLMMATLMFSK